MRRTISAIAVLLCVAFGAGAAEDARTMARGREMSDLFLQRKIEPVWQRMAPPMQQAFGGMAKLEAFREQVAAQGGEEGAILEEKTSRVQGADVYLRIARWTKVDRIAMQWAFDDGGRVIGFFVRPDAAAATTALPTKNLDYQTRATLRLPFEGEWFVVWGGRTLEQNYHAANRQQRFAYDLLVVREGRTHKGDGRALEDYYCWDRPILAPAKGRVVTRVDGLPDQAPGSMDPAHPPGNHVVLDLGQGEYALLAHLRQGSVRVKEGDEVQAGDPLGRCGNSGNTSEPHLHIHLQDAPRFGEGEGLPGFFTSYKADGKPVDRGEPLKGQRIEAR